MSATKELPVGIIGAGMSGLMAAFHLTQRGVPVRVFEARERIGGRTLTVTEDGSPWPIELGAEFIHGAAEPTLALADAADVPVERVVDEHARFTDGSFHQMGDMWKRYAKLLDGADGGPDESAAEYSKQKDLSGSDAELFRLVVEGFEAAPIDDVSVQSLAREAKDLSNDAQQFRPVRGYGALSKALIQHIPPALIELCLNAVVQEVSWQPDGHCTLRVREGDSVRDVETRRCVITVPLGVLQSTSEQGAIRFSPAVDALSRPLNGLAMGHVVKLVLLLREQPWMKALPDTDFFHLPEGNFSTFWQQRAPELRMITAWIGGSKARSIEALHTRDLLDQVASDLAACCEVLPGEVRETLVAAHHHDFSRDPFSLGAYPYARKGGADCLAALTPPVENTLFFAGDATDPEHFGTVAGAIASGARAARQILSLGVESSVSVLGQSFAS
jgi:monoamine oxidase